MALSTAVRWRLRVILGVGALASLIGAMFSWIGAGGAAWPAALAGGALIGLGLTTAEIMLPQGVRAHLRRWPPVLPPIARAAFYAGVFYGVVALVNRAALGLGLDAITVTPTLLVATLATAFAFNLFFMFRRLLGPRTLIGLLAGRYNRPRREERIVLLLDVAGSTGLAEQLGDERFVAFLNRIFFDLRVAVHDNGADIYRYVGDEIILTWTLERGLRDAACLACLFAVLDTLEREAAGYRRDFGTVPRLRAALHAGSLIVAEMGDTRREVVMLGDMMNTAARIEDACRTSGRDYVASAALINRLVLPAGVKAESLGPMALRGKAETIELFALARPA
jgi:adenylate cyclase